MKKPILLSPETTEKIWLHWLQHVECGPENERRRNIRYAYRHQRERFDSWLWSQGGAIRVINKKYHIEAYDADATVIALKWS